MNNHLPKLFSALLILMLLLPAFPVQQVQAVSPDIVISQVYGAGGNSGATYNKDYVELFNLGVSTVNLAGLSLQYASATGNFSSTFALSGSVAPGQYFLVGMTAGTNGVALPVAPDLDGTLGLGATAGKVILANGTTALSTCGATGNPCSTSLYIDLVGYGTTTTVYEGSGPAPAPSTGNADFRGSLGCTDTDNNNVDFTAAAASPRNSASPLNPCGGGDVAPSVSSTTPANSATNVAVNANIDITFSEAVNTSGSSFGISCGTSGVHSYAVSGGPTTFTLDPNTDFANSELCTVTVVAAQVTDQDDTPDNMPADHVFSFTIVSAVDDAPSVSSTTPTNTATNVAVNATIDVTFSEAVNAAGGSFGISCGTSGVHTATVNGGATTFTLNPDSDFANGETCTVTVLAAQITDQDSDDPPDTMAADYVFSFNTVSAAPAAVLVINEIDYDQSGTDGAEFVEIRNNASVSIDLGGYSVQMFNGSGGGAAQYRLFALPAVNLAQGDYFVLCGNTSNTPNCDLDVTPDTDLIQNGAPDAVALLFGASVIDTVSYEGNTGAPYTEGVGTSASDNNDPNLGISRLPDGVDTNQNNSDFSLRCITPGEANSSSTSGCVVDSVPSVISTNPLDGAIDIAVGNNIDVNFSEAVTVSESWFSISCANSSTHTASVSGGPQNYTLNPDVNFAFLESCSVAIVAANVADQDGTPHNLTADYNFSFTTGAQPFVCGDPATFIHDVQGNGLASPLAGNVVTVEGVVVGSFQGTDQLGGFYIQEEDSDADADATTSEGIFIFNNSNTPVVGDTVRIQGAVDEFNGLTELKNVANFLNCGSGGVVTTANVTLPVTSLNNFEAYEGMLVTFPQALYISEYFNYDHFGEIVLTSERHLTPTAEFEPGVPAIQAVQDFLLDMITLNDGRTNQNPDPARHPDGGVFDLSNLFRGGDTLQNMTGVMDYAFGFYRIQPTQGADHVSANPRTAQPADVGGDLKVASFNVLNYFTTLTSSGAICGPLQNQDCRGANDAAEFTRQRDKIIAAITAINADVVGLLEIENNVNDEAVQDLVDGLNAVNGAGPYAYVNTGVIGGDAIKVALIYKPAKVSLVGSYAILDSTVDARFIDTRNRPVLAQTFMDISTGGVVTVAVNHLKSKGSTCDGDPDLGDGAGNCNQTRKAAAEALVDWLASDPTGSGDSDFLIIGDLNAYDKEDPIDAIKAGSDDLAGTSDDYTDMVFQFQGEDAYSYVFDGQLGYLDHALASASLVSQITGVADWHINADEPDLLDYNTDFKEPAQDAIYAPDAYRSSDHDPVIVGLNLTPPPPVLPQCNGQTATVYVDENGVIVGGLYNGRLYRGALFGSLDDDVIVSTDGYDQVYALGGNDVVCALGGDDLVYGGMGDDTVFGGDGRDAIFGLSGKDMLDGGADKDVIDGGFDADILMGGSGNDVIRGDQGADALNGGDDWDICNGGPGSDTSASCEFKVQFP